jgi:ATP-dependent protease HslVU (ClpYQ) peptidase subunit
MTILVAVKKNQRVFLGADRITTFGNEYSTDLVNSSKIIKLPHAYIATSGYTLLDNVIEHLYETDHKMIENTFKDRAQVFYFFLQLFTEMRKNYTLVDTGKDTYATMYNVFLLVTPHSVYGVSNNLAVHEYERFAAKGAGSDYAQGCLYGTYDLLDDGFEITRLALESACHFSIYCKEPLDIIEVREEDFGTKSGYKDHLALQTIPERKGTSGFVAVRHDTLPVVRDFSVRSRGKKSARKTSTSKGKSSSARNTASRVNGSRSASPKSAKRSKNGSVTKATVRNGKASSTSKARAKRK